MTTAQLSAIAPLATALPEGPSDGYFTPSQWTTLLAIMDTVIPSIRATASIPSHPTATNPYNPTSASSPATNAISHQFIPSEQYDAYITKYGKQVAEFPDRELLDKYMDERASDSADFQEMVKRTLCHYAREDARKGLALVLSALNTRIGCLLLTGYSTPFHLQPVTTRTKILDSWRTARLAPLKAAYKQMTFLGKSVWIKTSPTFYSITGYPKVPVNYKAGAHHEYDFIQFPPGEKSKPEIIEADVVIVGSGCGGGVCAKNLAEAGFRVVVVDKSYYYPPTQLPMSEKEGGVHLFENGGAEMSDDGSTTVVIGSTWGGGGTINWSASLQTQSFVRQEWAEERGLPFFASEEFQTCLDRVCDRMGVSDKHIRHNHANQVLMEGSRKLGYTVKAVPQNTGGHEHHDGYCTLGCGAAEKQGPAVTWLPDAAKAGANFIEGFKVDKVLFDDSKGEKKATGVKGVWTSRNSNGGVDGPASERTQREVVINAKKVIVSCGTFWSPIILLNSGLKNKHIGRNLYLHPVNFVAGVYKEDVKPWEGGILTSVCTTFENLDGHGHGVKLETTCMLPSFSLTFLNWPTGLDFKLQALKYRHTNAFISITRDRDTGRVYADPTSGLPRIDYSPTAFDRAHTMVGLAALAKIAFVTQAEEIHVGIAGVAPFIRNPEPAAAAVVLGSAEQRFDEWWKGVLETGNLPPGAIFASAHQMGSNRMAAAPAQGVVDPKGHVWGTKGLLVSDASIFPSASGVNPMVTNMAISDMISRELVKELRAEEGRVGVAKL